MMSGSKLINFPGEGVMLKRLGLLVLLLSLFPLQPVLAARDDDPEQIKARLSEMKQQLRALQEELARTKAEQALQQTLPTRARAGWLPVTEMQQVPTGYGRYVWVLFTATSGSRDQLMLSTLLDTLPERGDLPIAERTLFLVPSRDEQAVTLAPETYAPFAENALLDRFRRPGLQPVGPLLLVGAGSQPELLIDLEGRSAPFLKQVLLLLRERSEGTGVDSLLRRLISVAGEETSLVREIDGALLVSWTR